jgi:hypothetical protein
MSCYWLALLAALSVTVSQSLDETGRENKTPEAKAEQPEALPAPRRVERVESDIIYVLPSLPPQLGTREVWQYYGVDRSGRFLPRVVLSPHGAYYLYNGRPYPWTTTRPGLHMPYALD